MLKVIFVMIVFCVLMLVPVVPVQAIGPEGDNPVALQPLNADLSPMIVRGYFIFNTAFASTTQSYIRVINVSQHQQAIKLAAVDATTGQTSGAVYLALDAPRRDVGAWTQLSVDHLVLAAGESRVVGFKINIPRVTWPGQHVGGIVAETILPAPQPVAVTHNVALQVKTQERTIIAVQANIPGSMSEALVAKGMSVGSQSGYQIVSLVLQNSGATLLQPTGSLRIYNEQHQLVQNLPVKMQTILPHTSLNYPVFMQQQALAIGGSYKAELELTYGHQHQLQSSALLKVEAQHVQEIKSSSLSHPVLVPTESDPFTSVLFWMLIMSLIGLIVMGSILWRHSRNGESSKK